MQKVALITKQRQLNAVESTGNQNNQIKPCRFVLTVQQYGLSAGGSKTQVTGQVRSQVTGQVTGQVNRKNIFPAKEIDYFQFEANAIRERICNNARHCLL